jgi:putative flippase GtrA
MARAASPMRFARFLTVGAVNTLLTVAIFNVLVFLSFPAPAANAAGYAVGVVNSFVLNRRWTFGDREGLHFSRTFWRFALVSLGSLAITTGVVALLEPLAKSWAALGAPLVVALNVAEGIAILVGLVWNYLLMNHWAFAQPAGSAKEVE